jgi:hypothetical protein
MDVPLSWKETEKQLNWLKETHRITEEKWRMLYSEVVRWEGDCKYLLVEDPPNKTWEMKILFN